MLDTGYTFFHHFNHFANDSDHIRFNVATGGISGSIKEAVVRYKLK